MFDISFLFLFLYHCMFPLFFSMTLFAIDHKPAPTNPLQISTQHGVRSSAIDSSIYSAVSPFWPDGPSVVSPCPRRPLQLSKH